jgi:hypothetical protein
MERVLRPLRHVDTKTQWNMPMTTDASDFMIQEYSRMIDVYQDLHVQKNELLKVYLTFASLPVSLVAIFLSVYKYLDANPQAHVLTAFQSATIFLSVLLILVGVAVLMIMLSIRTEQYLYVQAVNAARKYFKETHNIDVQYIVLPFDPKQFTFAQEELQGRPYWEAMIISFTTSMLFGFLSWQLVARIIDRPDLASPAAILICCISIIGFRWFIRFRLTKAMKICTLTDLTAGNAA